jgi:cobalamin biosynthesis Mg chelatase CobN
MAKKGSRPNKANQQKSREDQWRRRAAAQMGGATSVAETDGAVERYDATLDDAVDFTAAEAPPERYAATPRSTSSRVTPTRAQSSTAASSSPATQRRGTNLPRQSRARYAANVMSIEDEMYYVRSDIRRLILLTAACVLVLIVLLFVLPR